MTSLGELYGDCEKDFIFFEEESKRGDPMGFYKGCSVFAANGYKKTIQRGKTYYCKLEKNTGSSQHYNAIPEYELTLEKIMEEKPDCIDRIALAIYNMDPNKFDSRISAVQIREIEDRAKQKQADRINRLEKDNERLTNELKARDNESTITMKAAGEKYDHLDGDMFYSGKLEEKYYSARVDLRKDRILLIKDENGKYGGHGGCIDISPFKKMLDTSDVKVEYCDKYSGVVISKRV